MDIIYKFNDKTYNIFIIVYISGNIGIHAESWQPQNHSFKSQVDFVPTHNLWNQLLIFLLMIHYFFLALTEI